MNALSEVWALWWIGSFCACAIGLLLARMHRAPVHRVAWLRWSLLSLFVWALAALIPTERWIAQVETDESESWALRGDDLSSGEGASGNDRPADAPFGSITGSPVGDWSRPLLTPQPNHDAAPIEVHRPIPTDGTVLESNTVDHDTVDHDPVGVVPDLTGGESPSTARRRSETGEIDSENTTVPVRTVPPARDREPPAASTPFDPRWITALWLCGTTAVLIWLLIGRLRLHRILARCETLPRERVEEWIGESDRLGSRVHVLVTSQAITPFCIGPFRPRVVLPEHLVSTGSDDVRRAVLEHELSHLAHRDPWTTLIVNLALIAFWPQPLVWMLRRALRREVERRADERAALRIGVRDYAARLIELRERLFAHPSPAALTMARQPSEFFRRMETLMQRPLQTNPDAPLRARLLRGSTAVMCCALAIASFGRDVQAQDPARVRQVEQRLDRVESRLDEMSAVLKKISISLQRMAPPPAPASDGPTEVEVPGFGNIPTIGSLFENQAAEAQDGVPVLQDLPLLSSLFRNQGSESASDSPFAADSVQGGPVAIGVRYLEVDGRVRQLEARLVHLKPMVEAGRISTEEVAKVVTELDTAKRIRTFLEQAIQAEIRSLKAQMAQANEDLDRTRKMADQGYVSSRDVSTAETKVVRLRNELLQMQDILAARAASDRPASKPLGVVIDIREDDGKTSIVVDLLPNALEFPKKFGAPRLRVNGLQIGTSDGQALADTTTFEIEYTEFGPIARINFGRDYSSRIHDGDTIVVLERRATDSPADDFFVGRDREVETGTGGGGQRRR